MRKVFGLLLLMPLAATQPVKAATAQRGGFGTLADGTVVEAVTPAGSDGDRGYPGKLDVTVTYALDDKGSLTIDFAAASDRPTIVNLTNHARFDMAGEGSSPACWASG